jgi:hypothetical protein
MKILDRLPISEKRASLPFGDRFATLHRNQLLVWVSIHSAGALKADDKLPRFPALLDTGNNFGFSMQDRHLREGAGIDHDLLVVLGDIEINGQVIPRRSATVWLYPNIPGRQDVANGKSPFRLSMGKGIAVYPQDAISPGPRLPLLGLPAFLDNDLDWWLVPERRHMTVQTRTWRRSLIRVLCRL